MITLQKTQDTFKILNLTDPQLSDAEWEQEASRILTDTVTALVRETAPDLITVSGDLAWAQNYISYTKLTEFLDGFGIPWAPVFGNHDCQCGAESLAKAAAILTQGQHCLFESGDPALGNGNYVIGIEQDGRLVHALLMMDSHDKADWTNPQGENEPQWAQLIPEQFTWYAEAVDLLTERGAAETTLIMHIPLYTYREALTAAVAEGVDLTAVPCGKGEQTACWAPGYADSFGVAYEGIASYPEDNGFFNLILEKGSTKTVLCGHDHVNNFSIHYRGVRLMYSLKTGPGCYWNKQLNGGTLLTIDNNGHLTAEHHYVAVE